MSSRISYIHKMYETIIRKKDSLVSFSSYPPAFLIPPSHPPHSSSYPFSLPAPPPHLLQPPPLDSGLLNLPFLTLPHLLSNPLPFPSQHLILHEKINRLIISCYLPLWYLSSPPQSVYPGRVVVVGLWGSWYPPSSLLPGGKNY